MQVQTMPRSRLCAEQGLEEEIRQEAADRKTALEAGVVLGAQTEAPAQPDNDKEEGDADEKD